MSLAFLVSARGSKWYVCVCVCVKNSCSLTYLSDTPVQVEEAPGEEELRADRLVHAIKVVSQEVGKAIVTKTQACYLPISADGEPLIGQHPKVSGAYFATGHGCWGILNAPATGAYVSLPQGLARHPDT
jgi:glycine/D-amino acid oxidase-like deaminating enzyme